jgi:hypothetical protein
MWRCENVEINSAGHITIQQLHSLQTYSNKAGVVVYKFIKRGW